jgi:hypothetical protein
MNGLLEYGVLPTDLRTTCSTMIASQLCLEMLLPRDKIRCPQLPDAQYLLGKAHIKRPVDHFSANHFGLPTEQSPPDVSDGKECKLNRVNYKTSELEVASLLRAQGHRLVGAKVEGRVVMFEFEKEADRDVERYFSGAEVSARDLFEAHRSLRALIQQVREHEAQEYKNNGADNPHGKRTHSRVN